MFTAILYLVFFVMSCVSFSLGKYESSTHTMGISIVFLIMGSRDLIIDTLQDYKIKELLDLQKQIIDLKYKIQKENK